MKPIAAALALCAVCFGADIPRPRITGVAHAAYFVKDMEAARRFYNGVLGLEEPYTLKSPDMLFFKVNERQYVEIFPERAPGTDRLHHIALEVEDAEAMRRYLASKGVKVPEKVGKGRIGNLNFNITDPAGHTVEIVQYMPDSWTVREKGKAAPASRISKRMMHTGIIVQELQPAMAFYRDVLGFQEFWRGTRDPQRLSWINMRVPDGEDYIEFMLQDPIPEPTKRGSAHHICLEVPDIESSKKALEPRVAKTGYDKPLEIRTGVNRKRQLNLFDADGTRTELMEPNTVDGKPTPSSTAPWLR